MAQLNLYETATKDIISGQHHQTKKYNINHHHRLNQNCEENYMLNPINHCNTMISQTSSSSHNATTSLRLSSLFDTSSRGSDAAKPAISNDDDKKEDSTKPNKDDTSNLVDSNDLRDDSKQRSTSLAHETRNIETKGSHQKDEERQSQVHDHHHHHPYNSPYSETTNAEFNTLPPLPFHSHQELALAERSIKRLVVDSQFFPPEAAESTWFRRNSEVKGETTNSTAGCEAKKTTDVTTLYESELYVDKVLGHGGFCEVRLAQLRDWYGRQHAESEVSQQRQYAIKYLLPAIKNKSKKAFSRGAADLAIEARFLSLLQHENIIKLHFVSAGSLAENYNCLDMDENDECGGCGENAKDCSCRGFKCDNEYHCHPPLRHFGYFLILDYVHDTLFDRIRNEYINDILSHGCHHPDSHHNRHYHHCHYGHSRDEQRHRQQHQHWWSKKWELHPHKGEVSNNPKTQWLKRSLADRLNIVKQIGSALYYLHDTCHIVFRDVKPDNIGFYRQPVPPTDCCCNNDECGYREIPKLFDFGLAKELKPCYKKSLTIFPPSPDDHYEDDFVTFKLTGRTGSRRYMCPEVAFSQSYNHKADVYSFGILLYETVSFVFLTHFVIIFCYEEANLSSCFGIQATLIQPYQGMSLDKHEVDVLKKGHRPCLVGYTSSSPTPWLLPFGGGTGGYWPHELKMLIEDCWSHDMRQRPEMKG
ncbi:predicted protein [Thalassiosira pseudonana CCMP1335]|uniref:Protein kinase domain-containing protein n=1 Tax=Thalassiosira pseudonana TaxID=35128 RepID=B5YM81_THAPS|nr:predicted protein [Thalassiosira pseudonana CCMP1335]ACI64203.1 predicted protein [Thalassiosira pseudonana CCMP1335]